VSAPERLQVEESLRRIDERLAALGHIADPGAREAARELVEAVLDLHGLALARVMALAAADSPGLLDRFAQDEQIKAVLLLYGLHPQDPAARIEATLAALRPRFAALGAEVELVRVTATAASVRVTGCGDQEDLRREVEEAIANAAPDLDEMAIHWAEPREAAPAPALAG